MDNPYLKLLNLKSDSLCKIVHEDAMVAEVYKVLRTDGQELILKISERERDFYREAYFLKLLSNLLPVPKIIQLVEPSQGVHGAILMECLRGDLLSEDQLNGGLARELGSCLAILHKTRASGYGDPLDSNLSKSPAEYFAFKFYEGIEECKSQLPLQVLKKWEQYFKNHVDRLSSVDGPCFVHRDFRSGNILAYKGSLQGIIDWAGARASFAEEDFGSIFHRPWLTPYMADFLSGYESVRDVPDYIPLIPFLRFNRAIAITGYIIKKGTWKTTDSKLYDFNRMLLDEFI